jgi:hypothetical protein
VARPPARPRARRRRRRSRARSIALLAAGALLLTAAATQAQEIEPRAYSNAPIGVNFLILGYARARGGLSFDTSSPVTDPRLRTDSAALAYVRVLDLMGKSAKFDLVVPYTWLNGSAVYAGAPVEREVSGFGDPRFRLSVNLVGAPALTLKEFASYTQDLIVGASLQVSAPMGQYDDTKLVNLGANRWYFRPEVGVSKALGRWTLEAAAAATLYTDNKDFYGGKNRSQDPLYSLQGHLIYSFPRGVWGAFDVNFFSGGRSTLGGVRSYDLQQNWRVGGTLAFPVDAHHSIKVYASSGVRARTGNDYDLIGIAWQYRWGGGL